MVNTKFSDSCIGFAAETKQCSCLAHFLGEDMPSFFASISYDLWNGIVQDQEEEELMTEKVIDLLMAYHMVKNEKEIQLF